MSAAWKGHTKVVRLLLSRGADRKQLNSKKESAVDLARSAGHKEVVQLLRSP